MSTKAARITRLNLYRNNEYKKANGRKIAEAQKFNWKPDFYLYFNTLACHSALAILIYLYQCIITLSMSITFVFNYVLIVICFMHLRWLYKVTIDIVMTHAIQFCLSLWIIFFIVWLDIWVRMLLLASVMQILLGNY